MRAHARGCARIFATSRPRSLASTPSAIRGDVASHRLRLARSTMTSLCVPHSMGSLCTPPPGRALSRSQAAKLSLLCRRLICTEEPERDRFFGELRKSRPCMRGRRGRHRARWLVRATFALRLRALGRDTEASLFHGPACGVERVLHRITVRNDYRRKPGFRTGAPRHRGNPLTLA